MVFAATSAELTVAIDLRSGTRAWERQIGSTNDPWVAGDWLYLLTGDAEVVCLDRETGSVRWVTALPRWEDEADREGLIVWNGPVLVGDRLVVAGSRGEAFTLSPYTGDPLGRETLPDGVEAAPVVADGTLYFLTNDGSLVAYR